MRSFISFQPGEVRGCVGCHESREEAPRQDRIPLALRREPLDPVPPSWGERPISFLRDIQPILDRHCVGCHSGLSPAGENYAKSKGLSDSSVQAVANMENYQVDERELEKFLKKGRLGEYAR